MTGPGVPAVEASIMVPHLVPLFAEAWGRTQIHDYLVVNWSIFGNHSALRLLIAVFFACGLLLMTHPALGCLFLPLNFLDCIRVLAEILVQIFVLHRHSATLFVLRDSMEIDLRVMNFVLAWLWAVVQVICLTEGLPDVSICWCWLSIDNSPLAISQFSLASSLTYNQGRRVLT